MNLGAASQTGLTVASTAAKFVPVYGGIISGALSVLGAIGAFGKGHVIRKKFGANVMVSPQGVTVSDKWGNSDVKRSEAQASGLASDIILALGKAHIELTAQLKGTMTTYPLGSCYHQKYNVAGITVGKTLPYNQRDNGAYWDMSVSMANDVSIKQATYLTFLLAVQRDLIRLPNNIGSVVTGVQLALANSETYFNQLIAKVSGAIIQPPLAPVIAPSNLSVPNTLDIGTTSNGSLPFQPLSNQPLPNFLTSDVQNLPPKNKPVSDKNLLLYGGLGLAAIFIFMRKTKV